MSILIPLLALTLGSPESDTTKNAVIEILRSEVHANVTESQVSAAEHSVRVIAKSNSDGRKFVVTVKQLPPADLKALEDRMLQSASPLHRLNEPQAFPAGSHSYQGVITSLRARIVVFTNHSFVQTEVEVPRSTVKERDFLDWKKQMPTCLKITGAILDRIDKK